MKALKPNQPVFFKKLPSTEKSPPNATMNRYLGDIKGGVAVEITTAGNKWIVWEHECLSVEHAMSIRAKQLDDKINAIRKADPKITMKALSDALGICESTLRRWNMIVKAFLIRPQPALDPKIATDAPLKG